MLLRDLQREHVFEDIMAWLDERASSKKMASSCQPSSSTLSAQND
jgi:hypothetical protein